jgi:hypothetical protein
MYPAPIGYWRRGLLAPYFIYSAYIYIYTVYMYKTLKHIAYHYWLFVTPWETEEKRFVLLKVLL